MLKNSIIIVLAIFTTLLTISSITSQLMYSNFIHRVMREELKIPEYKPHYYPIHQHRSISKLNEEEVTKYFKN